MGANSVLLRYRKRAAKGAAKRNQKAQSGQPGTEERDENDATSDAYVNYERTPGHGQQDTRTEWQRDQDARDPETGYLLPLDEKEAKARAKRAVRLVKKLMPTASTLQKRLFAEELIKLRANDLARMFRCTKNLKAQEEIAPGEAVTVEVPPEATEVKIVVEAPSVETLEVETPDAMSVEVDAPAATAVETAPVDEMPAEMPAEEYPMEAPALEEEVPGEAAMPYASKERKADDVPEPGHTNPEKVTPPKDDVESYEKQVTETGQEKLEEESHEYEEVEAQDEAVDVEASAGGQIVLSDGTNDIVFGDVDEDSGDAIESVLAELEELEEKPKQHLSSLKVRKSRKVAKSSVEDGVVSSLFDANISLDINEAIQ